MISAVDTTPFTKGPRIIRDDIPIVYVYDHCPFCVRVRLALGIKNVKHNLHFMANDDSKTPTKLVGKKIAPIFVSKRRNNEECALQCLTKRTFPLIILTLISFYDIIESRSFRRISLSWPNLWTLFTLSMATSGSVRLA